MEILEKIYLTVYLLSISIFLHYGNGGKIFFCKRIRIFFFKKIRREKLLISEKYMVAIKRYPWKGNVRELKNTVKRCLVVTEGKYWTINLCRCRCWNSEAARLLGIGLTTLYRKMETYGL